MVPRGAGTGLSGGALPLADGITLGLVKLNRILEVDYPQPLRRGPAGGHQPRHHQGGRARRLLLRAGSVQPDRLHDRRQHRRELGRRALPEIRPDDQQRARPGDGAAERRHRAPRRQASGRRGLRSAGPDDRLRGPAGRRHRGHGAHPAEARDRARPPDRLPQHRAGRRLRRRDHRGRHHPGRARDDGPPGDPRRRGFLPRRLPARRRGAS